MSAPAFDAVSSSDSGVSGVTSKSHSHTVAVDANFILAELHNLTGSPAGWSVTYGGVAMTLLTSLNSGFDRWYYLFNPPTGANTLLASWSGASRAALVGRSYSGVSKILGLTSNTSVSIDVTAKSGVLVVDSFVKLSSGVAPTVGAGQTQRFSFYGVDNNVFSGSDETATSSTTTMSWTLNSGGSAGAHVALALMGFESGWWRAFL